MNNITDHKDFSYKLANIITFVFQPVFMPLFALALWMPLHKNPFSMESIRLWLTVFTCCTLVPALVLFYQLHTKKVSDFFISSRSERHLIYSISVVSVCVCTMLLCYWGDIFPAMMLLGGTIGVFVVATINIWWKVSAHMAAFGCVYGAIAGISYLMYINPVIVFIVGALLAGALGWSRLRLKAHTMAQVTAGFIIGAIITFLVFYAIPSIYYL